MKVTQMHTEEEEEEEDLKCCSDWRKDKVNVKLSLCLT